MVSRNGPCAGILEAQVNRCSRCLDPHEGSGAFCEDCVQKLRERHLAWSLIPTGRPQAQAEDRPGSTVPLLFEDREPKERAYGERLADGFDLLEGR